MQYGRVIEYVSDGVKGVQTVTYFKGGKEMQEHRKTVIENRRVNNQLEEAAEYHAFAKRYHQDPTMLNPGITIEGKEQWAKGERDYYYVVLAFTQVES